MLQVGRSHIQIPMRSLDALWPWGRLSLWHKWVPGIFLGLMSGRRVKADDLTAICEPIVYKMWQPRRLTTLWAFTACYRDSFTFYLFTCLKMLHTSNHSIVFTFALLLLEGRASRAWKHYKKWCSTPHHYHCRQFCHYLIFWPPLFIFFLTSVFLLCSIQPASVYKIANESKSVKWYGK
jgi:hypothetical protein